MVIPPGDNDADDDDEPSGVMVGIFLDADTAAALATADGETADSLHLTLCYIGEKADLDAVTVSQAMVSLRQFAVMQPPLRGTVSGYGRFTNSADDGAMDVFYASVDMPGLSDLREDLVDCLTCQGVPVSMEHGFTPHITLAYLTPDAPNPPAPPNLPVRVATLTLAVGGEQTTFPLIGTDVPGGLAYMSEPQQFASKRHSASDQGHLDQAANHLLHAGAAFPPSPEQIADLTNRELSEAFSVQMTDDPRLHSMPFTLPQWFSEAADLPEWVPYLPVPHDFAHPSYGTVSITPERIANFVAQFNAGIYQDQIPLDGEHRTKESGALAWVKELRTNEDGSADARVTWTPRGEQMYRDGAFNYISPEWYDEWSDPATGQAYKDVAIGGALTTRPFFKAPYLRPLAASEGSDNRNQPIAGERSQSMTATTEQVTPAQFTELKQQFDEMQGTVRSLTEERDTYKSAAETAETEKTAMSERIGTLEKDARTKRFGELVAGWPGDATANVARLEKVADRFGEESDDFKDEVRERKAFAEQVRAGVKVGNLYGEIGSNQAADTDSKAGQLRAMATERAEKKGITYEKAFSEILEEKPELYEG